MKTWALKGEKSGDLLTYGGKILIHSDPAEMRYLFRNAEPVWINVKTEDALPLWAHPDLSHITWPIDRRKFRG